MKKLFFLFSISLFTGIIAKAQCDRTVTWTSTKTDYLDSNGTVKNTVTLPTTVQTTSKHITVTVSSGQGDGEVIQGDIKDVKCSWKQAYKDGKESFTSVLAKSNGETRNAIITIEAKDGKIDIIVEVENTGGRKMRLLIDNYKVGA
jgi:hypothetical protein